MLMSLKPSSWSRALGRRWRRAVVVVLLGLGSTASLAGYTLSFDPVAQTVPLGPQVAVTVRIGNFLPGGLGSYDFSVNFDAGILAFDSATDLFGLGFAQGLGSLETSPGVVKFSDFSFEAESDLLDLQGGLADFPLFRIVFDTLAVGTSALSFGDVTLGDAAQNRVDVDISGGSVSVEPRSVPEPMTLWLVMAGLVAGCGVARRSQSGLPTLRS